MMQIGDDNGEDSGYSDPDEEEDNTWPPHTVSVANGMEMIMMRFLRNGDPDGLEMMMMMMSFLSNGDPGRHYGVERPD